MSTRRPTTALTGAILMIALLISLTVFTPLTVTAADTRTPITEIEATTEMPVPTYGGAVQTSYPFTVGVGSPAQTADHMSNWLVYNEELQDWERYDLGVFKEGKYYYSVQIRIDQPYGVEYIFSPDATAKVNGESWILESINSYATYSYAYLRSPDYVVEKTDIPLSFEANYKYNLPNSYQGVAIAEVSVADCAVGGKEPYVFSKTSGPDWINVSESGVIGGTPTAIGENAKLVVRVTDAVGVYKEVTLTVQSTKPDPAKRESVSVFTITSDMPTPPAPGGECKNFYDFTFTEGGVAHLSPSMGYWQKHESTGWQRYNGETFTEGLFRYMIQLRIDGANGELYKLADEITVTVDGKEWQHETIFVEPTYSCVYLVSPEYTLEYEKITDVSVTGMPKFAFGDTPNSSTNAVTLPEGAPYTVEGIGWFDETADKWTSSGDVFEKDHLYVYSITLLPKEGYTFAPIGELTATIDGQAAGISRNGTKIQLTVVAGNPISYTVTFDSGEGTGSMEGLTVGGSYVLPECGFTAPEGKVFSHWSVTSAGPKAPGDTVIMTEDITVTAEWKSCSVTFEANGGVGQVPAVYTVGSYALPGCSFTPPRGYYFKAWAIGSPDGERKKPSETINVTEDVRVFAVWEKCTVIDTIDLTGVTVPVAGAYPTYDGITLNTAGVSINVLQWSKASSSTAVSPSTAFIAGEEYYLNLKLKVEEGYMLAPHQNNPYSFSVSVTSNLPYTKVEITGTGYIHLHYVVPVPYDVSFDANGGGGEMAGLNDAVGTYVLPECGFTAPVGHEFKCWSVNGTEKAVGDEITLDSDVTVKAVWTVNKYTITFNTDGGNAIDPITLDYGAAITAPADPTKAGYTFAGWDKAIPETMPAGDVTITAKWTVNKYTITFNTDGGNAIDPITLDYGASITAPADPAKVGHTFAGWDKAIPETMPAENVTVTAKWEKTVTPPVTSDNDPGTTAPIPGTSEPTQNTTEPIPGTTVPTPETTEPTPETTKPTTDENGEPLEDFSIVWVTISVVSVVLVASAATAVIFIKKKKGIE